MTRQTPTRRELLGALGVAGAATLAGCSLGSDSDDAIDPENDDVSAVLDAAGSAYEELSTYRATETDETRLEFDAFSGTQAVSEQQLMEGADGVFLDSTEEVDAAADLDAEAYERVGTEQGEVLGSENEETIEEYYVDGTRYEFDADAAGGEWTVEEDAEFDPPGNIRDFVDKANKVSGELDVESRNGGDSVALLGSFSEVPEPFAEEADLGEDSPFQQFSAYQFEVLFAAETARPETASLSLESDVDEATVGRLLGEEPTSASGTLTAEQTTEFTAFDESVEIELPDGVSA